MTATAEELDIEQLFDFEVPCAWESAECPHIAKWHLNTKCCNRDTVLCDEHCNYIKQKTVDILLVLKRFGCQHCGHLWHRSFDEWIIVTPLG